jgi:hypothetical protein
MNAFDVFRANPAIKPEVFLGYPRYPKGPVVHKNCRIPIKPTILLPKLTEQQRTDALLKWNSSKKQAERLQRSCLIRLDLFLNDLARNLDEETANYYMQIYEDFVENGGCTQQARNNSSLKDSLERRLFLLRAVKQKLIFEYVTIEVTLKSLRLSIGDEVGNKKLTTLFSKLKEFRPIHRAVRNIFYSLGEQTVDTEARFNKICQGFRELQCDVSSTRNYIDQIAEQLERWDDEDRLEIYVLDYLAEKFLRKLTLVKPGVGGAELRQCDDFVNFSMEWQAIKASAASNLVNRIESQLILAHARHEMSAYVPKLEKSLRAFFVDNREPSVTKPDLLTRSQTELSKSERFRMDTLEYLQAAVPVFQLLEAANDFYVSIPDLWISKMDLKPENNKQMSPDDESDGTNSGSLGRILKKALPQSTSQMEVRTQTTSTSTLGSKKEKKHKKEKSDSMPKMPKSRKLINELTADISLLTEDQNLSDISKLVIALNLYIIAMKRKGSLDRAYDQSILDAAYMHTYENYWNNRYDQTHYFAQCHIAQINDIAKFDDRVLVQWKFELDRLENDEPGFPNAFHQILHDLKEKLGQAHLHPIEKDKHDDSDPIRKSCAHYFAGELLVRLQQKLSDASLNRSSPSCPQWINDGAELFKSYMDSAERKLIKTVKKCINNLDPVE